MTYSPAPSNKLMIHTFQTLEFVDVNDILSVQAYENYSKIFLTKNRMYISNQAFGKFVARLEYYNFYQCHKSHLINMNHMVRYHKIGEIEMHDGIKIPLARRRKDEFLEKLSIQHTLS